MIDVYSMINKRFSPDSNSIKEFKDILDLNQDGKVSKHDIQFGIINKIIDPSQDDSTCSKSHQTLLSQVKDSGQTNYTFQ